MVMYNFLMYHLVRPIIQRHERRGEARGIAEGEARASLRWQEWNQRRMDTEGRGEPFTEPPPSRQTGNIAEP